MPAPSTSVATLRPEISEAMYEWDIAANQEGFVGARVLPFFSVAKQAGIYPVIPMEEILKRANTLRTNHSAYSRSTFQWETASYATEENGHESPIDDRESAMYADFLDYEIDVAAYNQAVVLREAEIRYAALFTAANFSGQTTAAGTAWSTPATADPLANVRTARHAVRDRCGINPDTLVMTWKAYEFCRENQKIIDLSKAQNFQDVRRGPLGVQALRMAFDMPKILIAGAQYNSAAEGQTATLANIWDDTIAVVCKTADSNSIREPSIGRTMHWTDDGSQVGTAVETYRDEPVRADIVRNRHDTQELLMYKTCGQLITGVTA